MGWLSGWAKRRQITIDHTKIDNNLTNFPVLLYLSASSGINGADVTSIFDEVGSNYKKIAVTLADGETQCYVEVEKWDATNEEAWLWVKVPNISATEDTILYIYYDGSQPDNTAYVGDPGETPAQNVWDEHFVLVTHMRDDPDSSHVRDSTSYANNGTKKGAGEPAVTTAGKIDDAQGFDGVDDRIVVSDDPSLDFDAEDFSISAWVKPDVVTGIRYILSKGGDPDQKDYRLWLQDDDIVFDYEVANRGEQRVIAADVMDTNWHMISCTYVESTRRLTIYLDGIEVAHIYATYSPSSSAYDITIGVYWNGPPSNAFQYWFDGIIDEARISNVARSSAWIKAAYETGRDNLLTWGSEETPAVAYEITLTEGLGLTDIAVKGSSMVRAEVLSLSDVYAGVYSGYRSLAETLSLTDVVQSAVVALKQLTETISLSDYMARNVSVVKAETLSLSDVYARVFNAYRTLSESLTLTDTVQALKVVLVTLTETISISDYVIKNMRITKAETISLVDAYSRVLTALRELTEQLAVSDALITSKTLVRELTESINLVDTALKAIDKELSESVSLSDRIAAFKPLVRTLVETLNLIDSLIRFRLRKAVRLRAAVRELPAVREREAES